MSQTVTQLTVEPLIRNGIKSLYCVPGVQNDALFDAIYDPRDELKPVQAWHEQGAAYMALGAAHARPDVPVVSIAGDGGALFTINELATAATVRGLG